MRPFLTLFVLVLLFTFGGAHTKAQPYETSLGMRGPLGNGITLKHFAGSESAIEGILALRYSGFYLTGLYEKHNSAFDVDHLYWYYGGGGHIGTWNDAPWWDESGQRAVIGVDGVIGLEYVIQDIPLNLSVDYKPAFNLIGHSGFWADAAGLSVRYIFGR